MAEKTGTKDHLEVQVDRLLGVLLDILPAGLHLLAHEQGEDLIGPDGVVQLDTLDSKIRMLREMEREYEGFSKAVRLVMQDAAAGKLRGIHGPVSKLVRVEDRYTTAIETALGKLKEAHKNADVAAIDTAMAELNAAWQAASQDIYAQQQAQQGAQPGADAGQQSQSNAGGQQGGGDGQPEDVEFEEVK